MQMGSFREVGTVRHRGEIGGESVTRLWRVELLGGLGFASWRGWGSFGGMPLRAFLALVIFAFAVSVSACSSKQPKSSAEIHQGNSPTIHFTDPEDAGGAIKSRKYR